MVFFFTRRLVLFYENGRDSETKSRKINPKEPNRQSCRGLQTGHRRNLGSYSKKTYFQAEIRIFGPTSRRKLYPSHGRVVVVQTKKCPSPRQGPRLISISKWVGAPDCPFLKYISLLADFGCFFSFKNRFLGLFLLFGKM